MVAGEGPLTGELLGTEVKRLPVAARLRRPWELLAVAVALRKLAGRHGLDVAHCFMASSTVAARLARSMGGRFMIVSSPPGVTQDPGELPLVTALRLRAIAVAADLVLAPSRPFFDLLLGLGLPRTHVLPLDFNAIPVDRYQTSNEERARARSGLGIPEHAPVATILARLHPVKHVDLLLAAVPSILKIVPHARVLVIGNGPARPQLEAFARSLSVTHAVTFAGERHDVPALLGISTVVVQTTYGVGGPGLSTLEALAAGCPVVCVDTGDRRVSLDGAGGAVFVPEDDVEALAEAVASLLKDPVAAAELGRQGQNWVRRTIDLPRVVDRLEEIYSSLTRDPSSRR